MRALPSLRRLTLSGVRYSSTHSHANQTLKQRFEHLVPKFQAEVKEIKTKYGDKVLGTCTVEQAYGGMRDVKSMVTETSLLDAHEGIRFRGLSIPECQDKLPKAPGGKEPLPEGIFWLMLTGEVPTTEQVNQLTKELSARSNVPDWIEKLILSFPKTLHPMSQFSMGILALQHDSKFAKGYREGMNKAKYWDPCFEDTLDILAKIPRVAALIYRNTFHNGKIIAADHNLDWSGNFSHMLGFDNPQMYELMRLYLTIHVDHEGGNVSAHTTHLVGSALSDPYLALAAGMNGLAGPLHGLANQEVLRWLYGFRAKMGKEKITKEKIVEQCWATLNSGQVIPGYGHAVLRKTDPRFSVQREFAQKHIKGDEMVELVGLLYEVVPDILTKHGKTKNPFPNVDAHSGVLLTHYGMVEQDFYTVLFGVSRAMGVLSSLCIDRALGLPLERPKSMTTASLKKMFETGIVDE